VKYSASSTCQIREHNRRHEPNGLRTHEVGPEGTLCHDTVRPWRGVEMVLVNIGPGDVTCGRCARIHRANRAALETVRASDIEPVAFPVGSRKPDEPKLMGAREAAEHLGVHQTNLRVVKGLPEPYAKVAATTLYRTSDIHALAFARRKAHRAGGR
jgi:hypothetical protein